MALWGFTLKKANLCQPLQPLIETHRKLAGRWNCTIFKEGRECNEITSETLIVDTSRLRFVAPCSLDVLVYGFPVSLEATVLAGISSCQSSKINVLYRLGSSDLNAADLYFTSDWFHLWFPIGGCTCCLLGTEKAFAEAIIGKDKFSTFSNVCSGIVSRFLV